MKAVIYARVSTSDQTTEQQVAELQRIAERDGIEVVQVCADVISGTKFTRTGLDEVMELVDKNQVLIETG